MSSLGRKGWISLLSYSPESEWGAVDAFYEDVLNSEDGKEITFDSEVWGTFQRKGLQPQKGDGIAFYHTTRAKFPPRDYYKRRPRISLIGTILDIEYNEREVTWIKVHILRDILGGMRLRPIVRERVTQHIFVGCGMVSGSIVSFYEVNSEIWGEILRRLQFNLNQRVTSEQHPIMSSVFEPPPRVISTISRIVRDTAKARQLKQQYNYKCQVCQSTIRIDNDRSYAEVHHIRPLGGVHQGLDDYDNMIVVCPNHHAMFDLGLPKFISREEIVIDSINYRLTHFHDIKEENVRYHNDNIFIK